MASRVQSSVRSLRKTSEPIVLASPLRQRLMQNSYCRSKVLNSSAPSVKLRKPAQFLEIPYRGDQPAAARVADHRLAVGDQLAFELGAATRILAFTARVQHARTQVGPGFEVNADHA